jgi:C4-dicarboxylate-specific signal transduction histidine kinase
MTRTYSLKSPARPSEQEKLEATFVLAEAVSSGYPSSSVATTQTVSTKSTGSMIVRLEQEIEDNACEREVLHKAADIARRNQNWQLAESITRLWGKVVLKGVLMGGTRRKMRRAEEALEIGRDKPRARVECRTRSLASRSGNDRANGLSERERVRLSSWLDGI